MPRIVTILGGYFIVINIIGFWCMGLDKYKAKKHMWRISEQTLFLIAIIGGSIGSILGMQLFHHKTKNKNFVIGMPVILIIEIVIFLIWVSLMYLE